MRKILILIVIVLIIMGLVGYYFYEKSSKEIISVETINSTTFKCAENKSIQAIFFSDKVELTLSDGRSFLISQAISASGARYANPDETFVFWNKGDTAFIEETDILTFKECLETK